MPVTPVRLTVASMVARTIEFVRSWLDRFIDVQGLGRAVALAAPAGGAAWKIAVSLVLGALAWTVTPYLLLGGRLTWRTLIPGGLLASVGMTILAIGSLIWLPHSITASAEQFGAMGVAFSILSWLFG